MGRFGSWASRFYSLLSGTCSATGGVYLGCVIWLFDQFLFAAERDVQRNKKLEFARDELARFYSLLSGTCSAT